MNKIIKTIFLLNSALFMAHALAGACLDDLLRIRRLQRLARDINPQSLMLTSEFNALSRSRLQTRNEWIQLLTQMHALNVDAGVLNSFENFFANTDIAVLANRRFKFFQAEAQNLLNDHEGINLSAYLNRILIEKLLVLKEDFYRINKGPRLFPILRRPEMTTGITGSNDIVSLNNAVEIALDDYARTLVDYAGVAGARVQNILNMAASNYVTHDAIMDSNRFFLYRLTGEINPAYSTSGHQLWPHRELFRDLINIADSLGVEVFIDSSLNIPNINLAGAYLSDLKQIRLSPVLLNGPEIIYTLRHELEHARFHHNLRQLDGLLRDYNLRSRDIPLERLSNNRQVEFIRMLNNHLVLFNVMLDDIIDARYLPTTIGRLLQLYDEARATEASIQLARELGQQGWEVYTEAERNYGFSFVEKYFENDASDIARFIYRFPNRYPLYIVPVLIGGGAAYVVYRLREGIWEMIVRRENGNADYYRIPID